MFIGNYLVMVGETETTLRTNTQQVNKYVKKFHLFICHCQVSLWRARNNFHATAQEMQRVFAQSHGIATRGSFQISQATSHLAGCIPGWEASQETTAPANDSTGGSTPLSQDQAHGPCAKAPCHGWDALGLADMKYWGPLVFTCRRMDSPSDKWPGRQLNIIQWPFSWRVGPSIASPTWVLMAFYIRWPFNLRAHSWDSPESPVVKTQHFKCRLRVWSLVWELRSHMLSGAA